MTANDLVGNETAAQNERVCEILVRVRGWLDQHAGLASGSATVWAIGIWRIETHYSYCEGRLEIRRKGQAKGRMLITRGRNDADLQLWIDALEACRP